MGELNISILSWNVNGLLGDKFNQFYICLENQKFPHIVCLQETHTKNNLVIKAWKNQLSQYDCYFNHGDGFNRGTAVLIHKSLNFHLNLEIQDLIEGRFSVLKGQLFGELVTIASIYAPVNNSEKAEFFERVLLTNLEGINILMGDFNSSPRAEFDRVHPGSNTAIAARDGDLIRFMENSGIVDAWRFCHPHARGYTFNNTSRIDLILVSFFAENRILRSEIGFPFMSDHNFIMTSLSWGIKTWGNDFIRIRPSTITDENFASQVFDRVWMLQKQNFISQFQHKLRNGSLEGNLEDFLASCTTGFNYQHPVFIANLELDGNWWDSFKNEIFKEALKFQRIALSLKQREFNDLQTHCFRLPQGSAERVRLESELKHQLTQLACVFDLKKSKDSRINFEKYTSGFFRIASENRKREILNKIEISENTYLTDRGDIQHYLTNQYEDLYKFTPFNNNNLDYFMDFMPTLEVSESSDVFSYDEIFERFKSTANNSSPGPDGLPSEFYKKFFPVFGPYYARMLNTCVLTNNFPESWFLSHLKVIPKTQDDVPSFKTLRPLTLSNVDYKNLTGMVNDRMAAVSQPIIHRQQTGGLPWRQIQHSTFLIHLLINFYKETDQGGYIVALDNVKAFDKLNRPFLFKVLAKAGFKPWTINLIKRLYTNTAVKLIINGFLSDPFEIYSGVKQGCPLSPLLYALSMEPLARAILNDNNFNKLGFCLPSSREVKLIQHLDDMTLFAKNKYAVETFMSRILEYRGLSGSDINYNKSFIIRLDRQRQSLSKDGHRICGIPVLKDDKCKKILGIYFGSDIEHYHKTNWEEVQEKCFRALKTWTCRLDQHDRIVSLVGRALIVNVKVYSKLTYLMQTLQFSKEIFKEITTKVNRFMWRGGKAQREVAVLEAPKELGGLGLTPLIPMARSVRFKNVREYFSRDNNWTNEMPINTFLLTCILDIPVFRIIDISRFTDFRPLGVPIRYYFPKDSKYPSEWPSLFDTVYWDICKGLELFGGHGLLHCQSAQDYLRKSVIDNAITCRNKPNFKIFIKDFFSQNEEAAIWQNILLPLLDPKIQSFSYQLAHNLLPTPYIRWRWYRNYLGSTHQPWCNYCKYIDEDFSLYNARPRHIFINCPIAKNTWDHINTKLSLGDFEQFAISDELIYFRLGLSQTRAFFVSEVLWSLWKTSNHNYNKLSENNHTNFQDHVSTVIVLVKRLKLLSKIDKEIIRSSTKYKKKWESLNAMISCLSN